MVKSTAVIRRRRPRQHTLKVLSTNLRLGRLQREYSQELLAEKAGVHRTYVGDIERCEQNPTLGTLEALADGLGWSISDLLREPAEPPKAKLTRKRR